jgi:hypothetical protein
MLPCRALVKAICLPSGDQSGSGVSRRVAGQAPLPATIRRHHVDVGVAVPVAGEGDLLTVGRPLRI